MQLRQIYPNSYLDSQWFYIGGEQIVKLLIVILCVWNLKQGHFRSFKSVPSQFQTSPHGTGTDLLKLPSGLLVILEPETRGISGLSNQFLASSKQFHMELRQFYSTYCLDSQWSHIGEKRLASCGFGFSSNGSWAKGHFRCFGSVPTQFQTVPHATAIDLLQFISGLLVIYIGGEQTGKQWILVLSGWNLAKGAFTLVQIRYSQIPNISTWNCNRSTLIPILTPLYFMLGENRLSSCWLWFSVCATWDMGISGVSNVSNQFLPRSKTVPHRTATDLLKFLSGLIVILCWRETDCQAVNCDSHSMKAGAGSSLVFESSS